MIMSMMNPDSNLRPSAETLLNSEFLKSDLEMELKCMN